MNKHLSNKKKKISVLKKSVKSLRYTDESFSRQSYQIYIKLYAKYKASDCSKIRPDLPNLGFFVVVVSSLWNEQHFRSTYFWLHRKIFVAESIHTAIWAINSVYSDVHSTVKVFLIQQSGCFGSVFFLYIYINSASVVLSNCFLNDYIVKSRSLLNFDKKKTAWQFDVRSHVTQGLEIRVYFNINRFADLITDAICWNILLTYHRLIFIRKC